MLAAIYGKKYLRVKLSGTNSSEEKQVTNVFCLLGWVCMLSNFSCLIYAATGLEVEQQKNALPL